MYVYACKIIEHELYAGRAGYSRRALALRQLAVIVGHDLVGGAHDLSQSWQRESAGDDQPEQ